MTTDERLDRLTGIVETLAGAVSAHDSSLEVLEAKSKAYNAVIEALAKAATTHSAAIEAHDRQIGALLELAEKNQAATRDLERRWEAYLNTLRKQ